ncbi:hypothetical protein EON65_56160, partial [archaeon]
MVIRVRWKMKQEVPRSLNSEVATSPIAQFLSNFYALRMLRVSRLVLSNKRVLPRSVITLTDSKLIQHALTRLNDSYTHSAYGSAEQTIQDLRILHQHSCIIPKHYFAHGYSLASSAKETDLLHEITRLAIQNNTHVSKPHGDLTNNRLKDIITIGIKQVLTHDQYTEAYKIWLAAKEANILRHTDNQALIKHVYGRNVRFQDKKHIGKAMQPIQSSNDVDKLHKQYVELTSLLRSSTATLASLLPKARELIENILDASPTPTTIQPLPPQVLKGLRQQVVCLVQQQEVSEALHLLSRYLQKRGYEKREAGLKEMDGEIMGVVLAHLPPTPPRPLP